MRAEAAAPRLRTCLSSPALHSLTRSLCFGAARLVLLTLLACLASTPLPPASAAPLVPGVDPNLQHDLYADSHLPSFHRDARVLHELGATTLLLDRWCCCG